MTAATSVTYTPPTDADYYFFNIDVSTGSGSAQMTSCKVYYEGGNTPTLELVSIAISGTPAKTTYEAGEQFDPTGLIVTGTYSDASTAEITSGITWSVTPSGALEVGTTSVSVTATVDEFTSEPYVVDGLIVNEHVITPGTYEIIPNTTFFGIEAQTTGNHNAVTGTQNDITITHSGGSNFYCNESQIRTYKDNTLTFSVPSGYEITSIVLAVTDNASYNANVGTYTASTKTWVGNANEVVLTSAQSSGNYQITKITVTYEAKKTLQSIAVKTVPTKITYFVGETFDPAGLEITATYDDESTEDIAYAGNESDFTFNPTLETALTTANTSVTITYGGKSADQAITVNLIKLATPANLEATNVTSTSATLTWDAVANASSYEVNVSGDSYDETFTPTANSLLVEGLTANTEYLWSVKAIGDNTTYANSDENSDGNFTTSAPPTVAYIVSFDGNEHGTPASESITETEAGAGVTLPEVTPNTGYQFVGWATTNTATEADAGEAGETYYPTADITLYAVYNEVYTINYMINGVNTNPQVNVEAGTTLEFPGVTAPDADHVFRGWITEAIEGTTDNEPNYVNTTGLTATADATFYAVFAEQSGTGETTYTKLSSNSFESSATYVLVAEESSSSSTLHYFSSYTGTTANENWGVTSTTASDAITFTLSGTASALVAQDASGNYLTPLATGKFRMSSTSQTLNLHNDGAIYNPTSGSTGYNLRYNHNGGSGGFRWYNGTTGTSAYFYKVETSEITYSNYCTTIVGKALTSISLSGEYPTEFWKGEAFSHEGMIVTAHYDDESTKDVTASATFTGYDMNTAGEQTVTVTYETESTTYDITVRTIANTQETAYTVAEAKSLIDANPAELATTEVYVKGTVSKVDKIESGAITYWLDENAFEVYKGKNIGNVNFTSLNEISVDDDVIVYGNIKKYGTSTYEFDAGNYLVSHIKASTLSIENITVEIDGDIVPVIETNVVGDYTISYTSDNEEVVSVVDDEMVTTGLGEATITATLTAEGYKEATATFEVEVIKALTSIEVATEPTVTDYKVGDMFDPTGLVITATYSDETEEDIAYEENEDKFTFEPSLETPLTTDITSVTITYAGKETEQEISVRDLYTYNITWMANGNAVTLEPATVEEGSQIGILPTLTDTPEGFEFAGWSISESSTSTIDVTYVVNADEILYAVYSRVEGGSTGSGNYEKVTSALTDWRGDYLIAYSSEIFADGGTGGTDGLGKQYQKANPESNLSENEKTVSAQWGDTYHVTLEKIDGSNTYLLKTQDGKYNYQSSNANGLASTVNRETAAQYPITINFVSENEINLALGGAAIGAVFRYNTAEYFRFYKDGGQSPVYLYKKSAGTPGVTKYYTRVYAETQTLASLEVAGPSIILSGKALTVTGTMTNSNAANLIIEDGAQLIQYSDDVLATVEKNITGYGAENEQTRDGYYLIANPTERVQNDEYDVLNGATLGYDLYTFDPTAELEWVNKVGTGSRIPFDRTVGYLFASAEDRPMSFIGSLLSAGEPTNIDLVYYEGGKEGREYPGFNLLGNPYACNAYVSRSFYVIDSTELVLSENNYVAPCEGFFVEATAANQSVTISTTAPEAPANALSLTVSQNRGNVIDRAIVSFDGRSNLHKFMMNPAHTNLSIAKAGETFAAISTEAEGELPVNFKAEKNGSYTITVNTENVEAEYLHLIDNLTGMDTDLLSTPSYTFDAKTSDYASRFKLVFGVKNDNEEMSQASSFAYINNGEIVISNEGRATLQVIDVLGRIISSETINGECRISTNCLTAGLYILNLNGMTQKIVVR